MSAHDLLLWFLTIAGGFFLGSILFCRIIPLYFLGKDVCALSDDHNPGAANVFVHCGLGWGFLCLGLDLLKGCLPVLVAARHLGTDHLLFAAVLAAPVLGHAFSPFHHFQGGKCIATIFGELLALSQRQPLLVLLAVLYLLFSTVVIIRPNRIRSLVTFGLFALISVPWMLWKGQYALALGCALISGVALLKHSKFFAAHSDPY